MKNLDVKILSITENPIGTIYKAYRKCYASGEVKEKTQEEMIKFIKDHINHESPLEHVNITLEVSGVSRALSHQLVRHRLASYSQRSQRYVSEENFNYVIPRDIKENEILEQFYIDTMEIIQDKYNFIAKSLLEEYCYRELKTMEKLDKISKDLGAIEVLKLQDKRKYNSLKKVAYENARYVLPNATETSLIMTMNIRELRHFLNERLCKHAQDEIRFLALDIYCLVKERLPFISYKLKCRNTCVECFSVDSSK